MNDDSDHDEAARARITLIVYGDSPRSVRAVENIRKALVARGVDPRTVETVDVMPEPEGALDLRIPATPQLSIGSLGSKRCQCGDLSDRGRLDHWLDGMLAPVE